VGAKAGPLRSLSGFWYEVLKGVRRVAKGGEITSSSLANDVDLTPKDASAWLSKLTKWGYLRLAGKAPGPVRAVNRYELTRWGLRFRPKKNK